MFWDRLEERARETIFALKNGRTPTIIRYAAHVTSACNMNCTYCNEHHSTKIMDRDLFRNICEKAGTKGIVHITGGEPLLVPWLEEEIYNNRNVTRLSLNSNLLKLPSTRILDSIFRLKTSLDDCDETRWNKIVEGNFFYKVTANIRFCSDIVKYTSVCFTATHKNIKIFPPFIDWCKEKFPNLYAISVSFYKGNNRGLMLTQEDIDYLFEASEQLDNYSKQLFLETHSKNGNWFPINLEIPCYLSLTELLIDEYGREYHCSHLYRDGVEAPGKSGIDRNCMTGCNARFSKFNQEIYRELKKEG